MWGCRGQRWFWQRALAAPRTKRAPTMPYPKGSRASGARHYRLDSGYEAGRKRRESGHGGTATAAILKKLRCPGEPQGFRHRLRTGLALSPYEPSNLVA